MWIVFDIIVLSIIIFSIISAKKKGFIKASYGIVSLILTFALMFVFKEPFTDFLEKTFIGDNVNKSVEQSVSKNVGDEIPEYKDIAKDMGLPDFLTGFTKDLSVTVDETKEDIVNNVTNAVTDAVLNIIAVILLFIIVRILLLLLVKVLDLLSKLPVINFINKYAGAVMGLINGLFIVYLACAVMIIFVTNNHEIKDIMDKTIITKFFYENNLLMMMFK